MLEKTEGADFSIHPYLKCDFSIYALPERTEFRWAGQKWTASVGKRNSPFMQCLIGFVSISKNMSSNPRPQNEVPHCGAYITVVRIVYHEYHSLLEYTLKFYHIKSLSHRTIYHHRNFIILIK